MDKVKLISRKRDVFGRKTNKGRKEGMIPAVVYGRGVEPVPLWIDALEFSRMLKKAGESTIIDLTIDGKNNRNVIINEIQKDPVREMFRHVDLFQVRMDEEIDTEVDLEYVGEAPAVKELGGVLVKSIDSLEIRCLPGDLPSEIVVDISVLRDFDDRICVADLKLSDKIEIKVDPETVIAIVSPPRTQEELEQLEEKVEGDVSRVEGVVKEEPKEGEAEKK